MNGTVDDMRENKSAINDIHINEIKGLRIVTKNAFKRFGISTLSDLRRYLEKHKMSDIPSLGVKNRKKLESYIRDTERVERGHDNIKDIYTETEFRRFVQYCNENGLIAMSDLNDYDFCQFIERGRFNEFYVNTIAEKYEDYREKHKGDLDFRSERKIPRLFLEIDPQMAAVSIKLFANYGIRMPQIYRLMRCGYNKIGDLRGLSHYGFARINGIKYLEKFFMMEELVKKTLPDILKDTLSQMVENDRLLLLKKRMGGCTLSTLSEEYHVTRERISQMIESYLDTISELIEVLAEDMMKDKSYISVRELQKLYENEDFGFILTSWFHNSEHFVFDNSADVFRKRTQDMNKTRRRVFPPR